MKIKGNWHGYGINTKEEYISIPYGVYVIHNVGVDGLALRYGVDAYVSFLEKIAGYSLIEYGSSGKWDSNLGIGINIHFGMEYRFVDTFKIFAQLNAGFGTRFGFAYHITIIMLTRLDINGILD